MTTTPLPADLCELTARDAATAIAAGAVTPSALLDAVLARTSALDDRVQAWCYRAPCKRR